MSEQTALVPAGVDPGKYFSPAQIDLIKAQIAPKVSNDELQLFMYQCARTGLDPFSRQIYAITREVWDKEKRCKVPKMTIQTGIDGYRLIADRTGRYAPGPDVDFEYSGEKPFKATAHVMKLVGGTWHKVSASAYYDEYVQLYDGKPSGLWSKPHIMLGKCAEALALRKAFPAELSGIYTAEEMSQADKDPAHEYIPPTKTEAEAAALISGPPKADSSPQQSGQASGTATSTPETPGNGQPQPAAATPGTPDPKEPPKASGRRSSRASAPKTQAPGNDSGTTTQDSPTAGTAPAASPTVLDKRARLSRLAKLMKNGPDGDPPGCGWDEKRRQEFGALFRVTGPNEMTMEQIADGELMALAFIVGGENGYTAQRDKLAAAGRVFL